MNTLESVTIGDYYQPQPKQQGALLIRPRGTLGLVFGTGHSPRPESWLPYVFTSTEEAAEAGVL
jgi:hypothetical protein